MDSGSELDDTGGDDTPSVDVHKHRKLIAEVQSLGNEAKSKYKFQRGEVAPRLSEFGLPSTTGRLSLSELVGDSSHLGLKKVVKRIEKKTRQPSSVLEPVLQKPEEEKQNRVVAYDKVKDELHKWDTVVWENRIATNLHFPLEKPSLRVQSLKEFADDFTPANDMESEVMALLNEGREGLNQLKVPRTRSEEFQMRKRALEEIRQRRAELIRQRMKVSYESKKNKHRNKIKSRRFHQVLRREKAVLQKKAEENATPEEAANMLSEKLAELEQKRIEERASLRHRVGGGKFADKQRIMARFDPSARLAVENMAAVSKKLTEKRVTFEDEKEKEAEMSENEDESAPVLKTMEQESGHSNPWFSVSGGEKMSADKPEKNGKEKSKVSYAKLAKFSAVEERDRAEFFPGEEKEGEILVEEKEGEISSSKKLPPKTVSEVVGAGTSLPEPVLTPALISEAPHNPADQRLDVAAAFAEDDVVAEFISEKEKLAKKEQPGDVDLSLPGWGGWAGPGISKKAQERRKARFILKAQKIDRKDANLPHVIIKEAPKKANEAISKHQPNYVPFPFNSARAFERSLRQPIGREWVPEISRRELIKPRIETQIGAIIEPLDAESNLMKKKLEEVEKTIAAKKAAHQKGSKRASLRSEIGKGKLKKKRKN